MDNLVEGQFGHGAHLSRLDSRDFDWKEIGSAISPFDWSKGYNITAELGSPIPVKNQGLSSSCGGQAFSYYDEILEAITSGTFEERSAKYIYSQTYVPGGGSYGRDNAIIITKQGVCRESLLSSYDNGNSPSEAFMERSSDVTTADRQDALGAEGSIYASVATDIDSVAQAISANHGAVLMINGENNGTWASAYPLPPAKTVWRHFLYAGKAFLENGKKYIGVLNSWGNIVGEQGWQYLSEDYFKGDVNECWTIVMKTTTLTPSFTHDFETNLFFGQQSDEVKALQKALSTDGEFSKGVPFTGYYGNITRMAVENFQIKYAVADLALLNSLQGKVVGPATRGQLNKLFNK